MIEARWDLPDHWKWVAARDVGEIMGGGTPSTGDSANFANKGIPWITPADLTGYAGKYISRGARDLSEKGYNSSGAKLMPPGTVLFSSRAPIGYCVIASNELATNQGFKSLVSSSEHSPEYLRYYLLSAKEYAESLASGTTFKELSGARMANLAIPVPPLPEQRRIVVKLDSLTGRTARAREELGRIPRLIQKYREAILAAAFRGELTREWRQTHVPKRVDDDIGSMIRRERDAQRTKVGIRGRAVTLPAIPLQWAWVTFDDCAWDLTVGHVGPMKDRYVASGIPFLRSLNIKPNQIDWQFKTVFIDKNFHTELSKSRLRPGDLVGCRRNLCWNDSGALQRHQLI